MRLIAPASEYLHVNHIAGDYLTIENLVDEQTHRRAGVAQELYPGGGVKENHGMRLARISSRSPSHPIPLMARASSSEAFSPATERRAKLTASRLVLSP